jgi:hypothetical protein
VFEGLENRRHNDLQSQVCCYRPLASRVRVRVIRIRVRGMGEGKGVGKG